MLFRSRKLGVTSGVALAHRAVQWVERGMIDGGATDAEEPAILRGMPGSKAAAGVQVRDRCPKELLGNLRA